MRLVYGVLAFVAALCVIATALAGQMPVGTDSTSSGSALLLSPAQRTAAIQGALSAAPANIAIHAAVAQWSADDRLLPIRPGTNGFTCIPGSRDDPARDAMCLDQTGLAWLQSLRKSEAHPRNSRPGIAYMLQGRGGRAGSDARDRTSRAPLPPPHWELLWPFDPIATGLPTTSKENGTWIMLANTPFAHLMIYQIP